MSSHTSIVISRDLSAFKPVYPQTGCTTTSSNRFSSNAAPALLRRQLTPQHEIAKTSPQLVDEKDKKRPSDVLCSRHISCLQRIKNALSSIFCKKRSSKPQVLPYYHPTSLDKEEKLAQWRLSPLKDIRILDKDTIDSLIGQNKPGEVYVIKSILQKPGHEKTLAKLSPSSIDKLRLSPSDQDDGPLLKMMRENNSQQFLKQSHSPITI